MGALPWQGQWVTDALGIAIEPDPDSLVPVTELVGMALRHNPRRAHLLVSTVLGKHLPADPRLVYGAGRLLGVLVADRLAGEPSVPDGAVSGSAASGSAVSESAVSGSAASGSAVSESAASGRAGTGAALLRAALRAASAGADPAPDARRLIELCDGQPSRSVAGTLVLGYAETATALGHCVAEALAADYLHSTRRQVPGYRSVAGFDEEHSHATRHLLLPADPDLLAGAGPLVLVDDELSTGQTVINTIAALHRSWPRQRYLVATLVDLRSPTDRARLAEAAERLGIEIEVVALASGRLRVPDEALATGSRLAAAAQLGEQGAEPIPESAAVIGPVLAGWPAGLAEGGRHGFPAGAHAEVGPAAERLASQLATAVRTSADSVDEERRILVLGCEELMYAPLRIAVALADQLAGEAVVRYSSTTRSPVVAVDDPGYAIRDRLSFSSIDDSAGERFAYNVAGSTPGRRFDAIVLVTDTDLTEHTGPVGLVGRLAAVTDRLRLVRLPVCQPPQPTDPTVPADQANQSDQSDQPVDFPLPEPLRGPHFGSYPAADVAWLLTDLSGAALEAPTEEREEAIQSGGAHYAESLPQEYQPGPEYQQLFADALADSADRLAHAVGVVTELVLDRRGPGVVLASLARAGTPVGVLMRRWARFAHGLELPHYSVSIVRARGIDELALAYLARHHNPAAVMFVDGWTGKGAIARELAEAIAGVNRRTGAGFSDELAVLADPGSCVSIYGTRQDYLIPSACLNSTVSGLVSRTVLNADWIGPGQFHGAKFYAELADADVSRDFVDAVTARFDAVAAAVARDWPVLRDCDRTPTWAGWRSVTELGERYGIEDANLIKPGVGETTRVLLRRVPERVLIRTGAADRLRHVLMLARQRGVPVEEIDGLAYSCVGLISPGFRRAATTAPSP